MKKEIGKVLFAVSLIGTILIVMAFSNSTEKLVGAIGDVKYSVLPPDKFIEENGPGWVLMDNNIPLSSSVLKDKHGILELPDARGMFIRGLNLNRSDDKADPFSKENNRGRPVGEYQPDQFASHAHVLVNRAFFNDNLSDGRKDFHGREFTVVNDGQGLKDINSLLGMNPSGGSETRPKNIALYIYIKINK